MDQNAFEFTRCYIHFCNNRGKYPKGHVKYNLLYKVNWFLTKLMSSMNNGWIAGEKVNVDKRMVKYCDWVIAFVQYMPKKLIMHSIKVFAVCCAFTVVLLGFEVYVGNANIDDPNIAVEVVKCLPTNAHLTEAQGCKLYTNNWYTSVLLAKTMYEEYGWQFCSTMTPTEKV